MVFDSVGKQNTENTLKLAVEAARAKEIGTIVIASNTGASVEELLKLDVAGLKIVCVTHVNGFREPGVMEMPEDKIAELKSRGVVVVTTTHALSGAERGISKKFGGVYPVEIMAQTLRMFGQGTKVCVEIAVMALDCAQIEYMKPVVAIAGSGTGQDTALIISPAHAANIMDCKINEIICKPRL